VKKIFEDVVMKNWIGRLKVTVYWVEQLVTYFKCFLNEELK